VLDFGCFDGGFLAYLGDAYEKFGIEPSADAARVAQSQGVTIVGATAAAAAAAAQQSSAPPRDLDAIVAFDVFEHLNDPVATMRDLRQLLRPGAIILIETGDTDTPVWRRMGTRYPYAADVDHVGLFNRSSITEAGRRAGFALLHYQTSAHHAISLRGRIDYQLYQAAYSMLRAIDALRIPLPARLRTIARGPMPRRIADDHFLAVLKTD
jgi:SAM-dependent methyltransferase